jgi:hypothetical protein
MDRWVLAIAATALMAGCGGGSGGSPSSSGGTTVTPPPPTTPTPPPAVTGSADLTWTAPTRNEDGSALTNLSGYRIRYGASADALTLSLEVPSAATTTARIDGLAAGTWYFTVASYTNTGVESAPAGPVWKSVQ